MIEIGGVRLTRQEIEELRKSLRQVLASGHRTIAEKQEARYVPRQLETASCRGAKAVGQT